MSDPRPPAPRRPAHAAWTPTTPSRARSSLARAFSSPPVVAESRRPSTTGIDTGYRIPFVADDHEDVVGLGVRRRRNVWATAATTVWLVIVAVPLLLIVITSLRTPDEYLSKGALGASKITLGNYGRVLDLGFARFVMNSTIVTASTMIIVLGTALPAAYAIVRSRSRTTRLIFPVYLFGLAIPTQAVIVPIYLIITRFYLYDSLTAIILPTAALALPMSIVVLTSNLRDIPNDYYEAMAVDGGGSVQTFLHVVVPSARPGMVTIGIFSGLNAWNGLIFPLVLTQSDNLRVVPLGLWNYQNQYGTDIPGLFAAVLISALPVLALYLFGRRFLLNGLAAGYRG